MQITFVLPYAGLQGGIRVIATHIQGLVQRGHQVRVISTPQVFTIKHTAKSLLTGKGLPRSGPSYLDGVAVSHRILESSRPVVDADVADGDVVVATYYTTVDGVSRLSPAKGAKVLFIQGYEVESGKNNPALDVTWRMPLHKIVISRWLRELARARFADSHVSLVPNSVDTKLFSSPARTRNDMPAVGFVYSRLPLKDCKTALLALKHVARALPSLRIVTFGTEAPDFRLPLPMRAEFHLRPPQEALSRLYGRCDLWLCSSVSEGFALPVLEAMACRCPAVATRCGGPEDLIDEGVNGHLVSMNDPVAMADKILEVLRLPGTAWQQMSLAALRRATRHSWDDATDLFEQALQLAVERTKRGELAVPSLGVASMM